MKKTTAFCCCTAVLGLLASGLVPRTGQAASLGDPQPRKLAFSGRTTAEAKTMFLAPQVAGVFEAPRILPKASRKSSTVESFASKISIAGFVLLTADQVARSMDSVIESAQIRRSDGTCLRLDTDTGRGVGLMLKLSRPIEF